MIPVITIDGPSGSGKGTISQIVAQRLGWNLLDSGALYRLLALAARRGGIPLDNEAALATLAKKLDVQFVAGTVGQPPSQNQVMLEGEDVGEMLRSEQCGNDASKVAALPAVREALLDRQRAFRAPPGLVADGRDMGSVVFPDADLKIFLTASAERRALRRYKQLKDKGVDVKIPNLVEEIAERDVRDSTRCVAPMAPANDAVVLDSSDLTIEQVAARVMDLWREHARR
ncbi:MAG: (d)CMP kinase [Gammaproteobacteria bacterium]|nr:(d)CMP kinase [Gammaproteobacteria bacterium]